MIRRAVAEGLPGDEVELIVVSDGSIDGTAERLLESRSDRESASSTTTAISARATRSRPARWRRTATGSRSSTPISISILRRSRDFLDVARREQLDFAIGSKRHPDSVVHYPRSRRIASWLLPAAQPRALPPRRTRHAGRPEGVQPRCRRRGRAAPARQAVRLRPRAARRCDRARPRPDPRAAGTARVPLLRVGAAARRAVVRALWDTAAIFYRLRILRTYQRKRGSSARWLARTECAARQRDRRPRGCRSARLPAARDGVQDAQSASGELVAVLGPRARPAGNWMAAAVPFFADPHGCGRRRPDGRALCGTCA